MAERVPSPITHPRDPSLYANKGFFDWVRRRLNNEIPPLLMAEQRGWNPPNIPTSPGFTSTTVSVPGASYASLTTTHICAVDTSQILPPGSFLLARVTAPDTVTVTLINLTGAAFNAGQFAHMRVMVWAYP
jgi:hypothetical protein